MNWITLLILSALASPATSQTPPNYPLPDFPKADFIMPMRVPMNLSGNFGETRKSHFHMGLDIKTNEREGEPVVAVGDGYISRINVSPYGYGNALYITHPNGYTSVYGHLQRFSEPLMEVLRAEQYKNKSFATEFYPKPNQYLVKQGEQIALSGNSGGSGGPHLHFEIRDMFERPINPLHFGYKVNDAVAPTVNALQIYSLDDAVSNKPMRTTALRNVGGYYTSVDPILQINATKVGISINTYDRMTNSTNSFGIYSILIKKDGVPIFEYKNDRHSFDEKRMIIAHLDYRSFLTQGFRAFHKTFKEFGNKLSAYPTKVDNGFIDLGDGKVHEIIAEVRDFNGNLSTVKINLQQNAIASFFTKKSASYTKLLRTDSINLYETSACKLAIPPSCLIDPTPLSVDISASTSPAIFSSILKLNEASEHLLDNYTLSIKTTLPIDKSDKAVIVWKDEKGRAVTKKASYENGYATITPREFGAFYVSLDTVIPTIRPISFSTSKTMGGYKRWLFSIADNSSGIESYNVFIDDVWTLAEYDAKYRSLAVLNEKKLTSGKHLLKIIVADACGNEAIYLTNFTY
jgi:hypothetical protein